MVPETKKWSLASTERTMEQYIARQPIFNIHMKLFAYELLYWGEGGEFPNGMDGDEATTNLLSSVFLNNDMEEMSKQRPCFINFTQELLEKNVPAAFPKNKVIVEILETVKPSAKVLSVCNALHEEGYTLVLDDFVYHPDFIPLLELAQIVKIDFRETTLDERIKLIAQLAPYNVKLLAEKVETKKEYEEAAKLGFHYFQGYFFCRAEKITTRKFTTNEVVLMQLLSEASSAHTDLDRLHEIISTDAAISYKLLRFINSARFYRVQPISSIRHAVTYLGERELRRFLMFMVISEMAGKQPGELMTMSLIRAKFCEKIAESHSWGEQECSEMFIVGLFSLLEVIMQAPMKKILHKLPIAKSVYNALVGKENSYARHLELIVALEKNDLPALKQLCMELGIKGPTLKECYLQAVKYTNDIL